MFIDTHCHLDFPDFDKDREEVISRCRAEGIGYIINIGSSLKSSIDSVGLAEKYDFIYASVGIHPHEADRLDDNACKQIAGLARRDKVVAIGEIGLDYFKNYSLPASQRPLFVSLLKLAKESDLPVVLHCRQAETDTLKIINDFMPINAVLHCFSGSEEFARECLDLGFLLSFTCNITYKKAQGLRDLIKMVPLERIMLETDAPYLSPEGLRGTRNEPLNVKTLAAVIAEIKKLSVADIAETTSGNAMKFFRLK